MFTLSAHYAGIYSFISHENNWDEGVIFILDITKEANS